ncbi:zinc finger protein RFP-like [Mauremys mutica]|uniref:zinc finger protein RFP-like n=1 Tax=Mauremys mutica TaxID=74926 RepID=UPI001D16FB0C|nr:zinc finger protein RFP-like [Mauremys mutica]
MATVEKLQEEASCSICLEYFQDPVSIHCGHNFCRACITQCWGELATNFSCPQCRQTAQQRNFRLNRELTNMVELVKQLKLPPMTEPEAERVCEKHREPLKLFCVEEQQLICLVCRESWAHGAHAAVPIEEAAQKYKEQVKARLQALKEEREKLLGFKLTGERMSWEYVEKIKKERQRIGFEFQQLRQFLEEQECLLLARLEELDRIMKWQKETVTRFPMDISHLNSLISELEGKCQQPASDFLEDIRITLSRCEMFQQPTGISLELEKRLSDFSQKTIALKETLRKFKDTLALALQTGAGRSLAWGVDTIGRKANVTLDPDTAHPQLVLSADGKGVRRGHEQQDLPDNPERFNSVLSVLGREGFTSGRHYWEVEVGVGGIWSVGVARESVRRKGRMSNYPEQEIWAVGHWGGQYRAYTSGETILPLPTIPRRIRVSLDYEGGRVAFFDVDNKFLIFMFPPASFTGERLFPFFLAGSPLRLCP